MPLERVSPECVPAMQAAAHDLGAKHTNAATDERARTFGPTSSSGSIEIVLVVVKGQAFRSGQSLLQVL